MLTVAYGEATLDRSNVYRLYKMFSEGRENVNDEEHAGCLSTSTTGKKINEVEKMILANRRITVREVAEDLNISIGSCHSIFINDLGMRRVAVKFVPKLLNCDQKQHRMNIADEMLDSVCDDPNLLQRVITGDEAWVYGYDMETKAQSSQWKLPHEPRPKKARQVWSNVKVLLTVFFDCRGVVHHEFLPQGRMVNKEYYLQVMRKAIRKKHPDLWKNKNWLLHHDNVPAHTSLLVRDLLSKNNTLMMLQPPYSPDLAPCDFFMFPKLKRPMKGQRYATLDEIKTTSKEELKNIFKNDFLKCFEDWKNRWHKCIISHGDYFEGNKIVNHLISYIQQNYYSSKEGDEGENGEKKARKVMTEKTTNLLLKEEFKKQHRLMKIFQETDEEETSVKSNKSTNTKVPKEEKVVSKEPAVIKLISRMQEASWNDRIVGEFPNHFKVGMLTRVLVVLRNKENQEVFVHYGGLKVVADWLALLPSGRLPHLAVREMMLRLLHVLPQDLDKIRESSLTKMLEVLLSHPEEHRLHKRWILWLLDRWAPPSPPISMISSTETESCNTRGTDHDNHVHVVQAMIIMQFDFAFANVPEPHLVTCTCSSQKEEEEEQGSAVRERSRRKRHKKIIFDAQLPKWYLQLFKECSDAFRMLTVAYGEATLDRSNVYRWYKMFSEGRENVNDEEHAGRPSTSTTDEKINEVEKMILANRRITVREIAEDLNISIGSCHSIFINDLGMRRVAAKFVPKLLNCDQKQHRVNIANEMLDSVCDDPNLLQRVITVGQKKRSVVLPGSEDMLDLYVRDLQERDQ
ncbi:hypothetical protein LAZ67_16000889 [Cordylochernes scorpioides]|uniref:Mos1 transposase HTH domain-containing protein n=1 Tax=Cordylochernes scorpioides TaxID=51811 RepID=A0ABY6LAX5_9ARAC|nr:hypothetical protein LAZ67_16000889 [Cordylochernes scorpioides]